MQYFTKAWTFIGKLIGSVNSIGNTLLQTNVQIFAYMPVTSISYKLRQFFLQTGMLYRGGAGEILEGLVTIHCIVF